MHPIKGDHHEANKAEVERIIEGVGHEKDDVLREHYRVLLQLVIEKNPQFIETVRRDNAMGDVLMEIVKDRVEEEVSSAVKEEKQQLTLAHISDIMKKLNYTAKQAMDLISVPQSQRSTYTKLLSKQAR
ncbi:MAG: hypothetical protein IJ719_17175 [Clostridia bacterium]|nr:hypothetical protein [Clostridia bacterium]